MRDGIAADVRAMVAGLDKSDLWVKRSPLSRTGYTNVIKVKGGKYQARLQVKGDGRGGVRKRKQYSLPGVFDTALEAAYYLAWVVKHGTENWENGIPPKQQPDRKPRSKKPVEPVEPITVPPAQPAAIPMPMAMSVAIPIQVPMLHAPFAPISPYPMQQLGYTPPFRSAM